MSDTDRPDAPDEIQAVAPGSPRKVLHLLLAIFWNGDERRVRALWRLVALVLLLIGAGLVIRATGLMPDRGTREFYVVGAVVRVLLALGVMALVGRLLDRRRLRDFGLALDPGWWADFVFGLVLGAGMMTAIFLAEWGRGWVAITGTFRTAVEGEPFGRAILMPVVLFLAVGIVEELLARGYLLRTVAEGLAFPRLGGPRGGLIVATVVSSVVFALGHVGNPNATWVSTVNIALAGALLALGLLLTGQLALSIGLHITWNFFQASVFGFPVSGVDRFRTTFIATEQGGPDVWTGGVFGPEAGLLGLAAMLLSAGLIVLWVRWRHGTVRLATSLAEAPPRRRSDRRTV
jgi:membrane protease YdiL (CAAX protease family)